MLNPGVMVEVEMEMLSVLSSDRSGKNESWMDLNSGQKMDSPHGPEMELDLNGWIWNGLGLVT